MRIITAICCALLSALAAEASAQSGPGPGADLNEVYASAVRRAQSGDVSGALARFLQVTAADPYWADAFFNVGSLSEHAGDHLSCALYFRRYLILEPEDPDRDDIERSIERCERAIEPAGTLQVTSTTPSDVRVAIEGVPMEQGSLGPLRLPPGSYRLSAEALDFHPWEQVVEVVADELTDVPVVLEAIPRYGSIRFEILQEGARVLVDGEEVGVSPLAAPIELLVGEYSIEVLKDGYHPWRRNVDVLRDLEDRLEIRLIDASVDLSQFGR